jgi:hypothetical protein
MGVNCRSSSRPDSPEEIEFREEPCTGVPVLFRVPTAWVLAGPLPRIGGRPVTLRARPTWAIRSPERSSSSNGQQHAGLSACRWTPVPEHLHLHLHQESKRITIHFPSPPAVKRTTTATHTNEPALRPVSARESTGLLPTCCSDRRVFATWSAMGPELRPVHSLFTRLEHAFVSWTPFSLPSRLRLPSQTNPRNPQIPIHSNLHDLG